MHSHVKTIFKISWIAW